MKAIERIAQHNGIEVIKDKMQEETLELHIAIDNNIEEEIIDEIADVMVVARQWAHVTGNLELINERVKYKIDRTLKRLGLSDTNE